MSAVLYRNAEEEDLEAVLKLWKQLDAFHHKLGMSFPETEAAPEKWQASFQRTLGRFSHLWVAESDGNIGAFLLGRVKQSPAYLGGVQVGEISDLLVSESLRGQGVGENLVRMAIEQFTAAKLHSVEVQIQAGNDGGLEFWKEQGFDQDLTQVRKVL
jgi:ribosomal protein S18 acetylase RimI-like enzyme